MIKTFETYKNKPKVGDWIIDSMGDLGEIIVIDYDGYDGYDVEFLHQGRFTINKENNNDDGVAYVIYVGTKEEMEIIIQTTKYNI